MRLNRAQRALWYAQAVLGDDIPISIAQCLEIRGRVDPRAIVDVANEVAADLEVSTTRVIVVDGAPQLRIDDSAQPDIVEIISLTDSAKPVATVESWMAAETAAAMPLDGPLVRSALIEVSADHWIFYARAHHILLDGFAAGLLIRHVAHRYCVTVGADAGAPPPAPSSVQSILDHEERYAGSPRQERDRAHWAEALAEFDEPLHLTDRAAAPSLDRHVATTDLKAATLGSVQTVAARSGVPPVAVLVAATAMHLARIRDRPVIPLTLVTSARTTAALRAAAGTMSNLLPIVVPRAMDSTVDDHLRAVAALLSGALRHQQFRYEEMLTGSAGKRAGFAEHGFLTRLGPVVNIAPTPPSISLGADTQASFRVLSTGPVSDVNVNIYPGHIGDLRVEVEANPQCHSVESAEWFLAGINECVDALATSAESATMTDLSPGAIASPIRNPSTGERSTLAAEYLRHRSSDEPAVITATGVLSYREIADRAAGIAEALRTRANGGSTVAVVVERSAHSVAAAWAVSAAGMCVVPIDPTLPERRKAMILADCAPAAVLTDGPHTWPGAIDLRTIEPVDGARLTIACVAANAPAYLLYTSGTTGKPKGVVVSHSGIADLIAEVDEHYALDRRSVVAHFASPGFDTAIVEMLAAAHVGAALAVVPTDVRGGRELAEFLTEHSVSHLLVTPAALATIPEDEASTVTHLIVGGDVCPAPLIRRWARSRSVRCAYGPTETTCSVALTDAIAADSGEPTVPLGRPMRGVDLLVLDRRLRRVPPGGDGDLYVAGPSLANGILHQPITTAIRFVACPDGSGRRMYRTGDRVRRGASDELWFLGRDDDQVKVRGVRVEPSEVDRAVLEVGMVSTSATVVHRTDQGARLHTYVVARPGVDASTLPHGLRTALRGMVGPASVPSGVTVLDELPLTVNRKVDRGRLPAPAVIERTGQPGPEDDDQARTVAAFESALGISPIGIDDDFFDLAGDSLTATAVAAETGRAFGAQIGVRDVFTAATPRALALLATHRGQMQPSAPVTTESGCAQRVPIAPAQRNVFSRRAGVDHLVALRITVPMALDRATLEAGIGALISRQAMLRSITTDDGFFSIDPDADPSRWSVDAIDIATPDWARRFAHRPIRVAERYPFRIGVAPGDGGATHIVLCFHHLAVDGASLRLLLSELLHLDAPPPALGYVDYAEFARARAEERRTADIAYFTRTVDTDRCLALVPVDDRPQDWRPAAARSRIDLPTDVWSEVQSAAHFHRVPTLTVLRSTLAEVLAARTGDEVIHIGALTSGRDDARWSDVVGMFVNTVCVACKIGATRSETIEAVHESENDAFAHSATAFTDVVDGLGPHDSDRHPLFQVMLTVDEPYSSVAASMGWTITPLPVDLAHCDLHVSVVPPLDGSAGSIEILYPAAMFESSIIQGILDEMRRGLIESSVRS
ncbi:non-ribosomal peptide synthetase [Gordonia zhaorongruii]|uniref:non-ribosomal peptide synthetase n=1 Tax=Gordonia zhaorongruii TaxID=2597659 RepID=UPI00104D5A63|nr:non-ribosomal peptide synthetase [Gordonia zhaorongruii]